MTLKALIIEDDYDAIRIMTTLLQHTEFETYVVSNGREAIDRLYELKPDIILLDIEMPRLDGIGFLKQAKMLTDATIIVISSVTRLGSPQAMEALELGVADIVCKPSGVLSMDLEEKRSAELLEAIHHCVENNQI